MRSPTCSVRFAPIPLLLWLLVLVTVPAPARAADTADPHGYTEDISALPDYLHDRGAGVTTTQFATYIRKGEWLVYTYYEYDGDHDKEYKPLDLGFKQDQDYFSRETAQEYLTWFAYGFSDSVAFEFETAPYTTATLTKSKSDTSSLPQRLSESGLGDTEASVRWRALKETKSRPEITLGLTTGFPLQRTKVLIGTQDWQLSPGIVVTKGFSFGTLELRLSGLYDSGEGGFALGEFELDYVKRISPRWRVHLSFETEDVDEQSLVGEVQCRLGDHVKLKVGTGYGITKKATDIAPEIGLMWSF